MKSYRRRKRLLTSTEFSAYTGVGEDDLRHWVALGLLPPVRRDKETGSPYYTIEQRMAAHFAAKSFGKYFVYSGAMSPGQI